MRDEIYKAVWGDSIIVGDRTIDLHVRKLREVIGQEHIATLKGVVSNLLNYGFSLQLKNQITRG